MEMEKIKIIPEQEKALKEYKHYGNSLTDFIQSHTAWDNEYEPLNYFTPEQFALLLCNHYEVEEDWQSWDYLKSKISSNVYTKEKFSSLNNDHKCFEEATKEEYVKCLFERYGRKYGEFKEGDKYTTKGNMNLTIINKFALTLADKLLKNNEIKHIYFVEDRNEL
jgi:hypothetical protein